MNTYNTNGAGKGDSPRPINKKIYDEKFSKINWKSTQKSKQINIIIHDQTK